MKSVLPLALTLLMAGQLFAEVRQRTIQYTFDGEQYSGTLVWDDALSGKRPGVLIAHQWMGESDYERMRAGMLAKLGYVAFTLDMYGEGIRATSRQEASKLAGPFYGDRERMRATAAAALDVLRESDLTDDSRLAVIGYCFGGTVALELARSGADLKGVVSFHGGLSTPTPEDAKNIHGAVLVCHGADDPHVPWGDVSAFRDEMREAGVDWRLVAYGNAVHAFTQPMAGDDPSLGAAYNEIADKASWEEMRLFFDRIFE